MPDYPPRMNRRSSKIIRAAGATAAGQRRPLARDNRLPETLRDPVGGDGCWCGNGTHGWPGDEQGAPHPRDWPGKREGAPYPVPEGLEEHGKTKGSMTEQQPILTRRELCELTGASEAELDAVLAEVARRAAAENMPSPIREQAVDGVTAYWLDSGYLAALRRGLGQVN